MNIHIEERGETDDFAFYLDGDLQFDSRDEALYHEGLALPPLCLARNACPNTPLRVLVCGGGDGLALRECLRFPGVAHIDLVDYSAEVVELGRGRFATLNAHAFDDRRVHVHVADAWQFLDNAAPAAYDVVLCDFTVPRRAEDAHVFTQEWYARVAHVLTPHGVAGLNAVSPQASAAAFWCLRKTVRAAGLHALPFRVCIPSFRDQGYGAWGFLLAAHRPLNQSDLRLLADTPVATRALDLSRLADAAHFSRAERRRETAAPVHTRENGCLVPLLLGGDKTATLPALDNLLASIPVLHPYHTRLMVETLAAEVVGSVRALDLRRLLDAVLVRAAGLEAGLRRELTRLRTFLEGASLPRVEVFGEWARRLFVVLVLLLTLANIASPDNVFGKGTMGLGHASISRGYGGSFGRGEGGSFGGGTSGFRSGGGGGSFGRPTGAGARTGGSFTPTHSLPDAPLTGGGFRGGWQRGEPTDIFGNHYNARVYRYRPAPSGGYDTTIYLNTGRGYFGGGGGATIAPQEQKARFVADDDMVILDNGDIVVTLSDAAYLVVSGGAVTLYNSASPDPVLPLYPDPRLFENLTARLQDQKTALAGEINLRRDWLAWVGWTSRLFPAVQQDEAEVAGLTDLDKRMETALAHLKAARPVAPPPDLPPAQSAGAIELFVSGGLLADGRVALIDATGHYLFTDGKTVTTAGKTSLCPPALASALRSVLTKLSREFLADLAADEKDLQTLAADKASLDKDKADYTSLANANGQDYDVDYGTQEIPVTDALIRTDSDLQQNAQDTTDTLRDRTEKTAQQKRVADAAGRFGK